MDRDSVVDTAPGAPQNPMAAWSAIAIDAAALADPEWECSGPWVQRMPLLCWLISMVRPRHVAVVGEDARPAFLAMREAIGALGLPSTMFGASDRGEADDFGDQRLHEGALGCAALHHLDPSEAQNLLVGTPVDLLVLDRAAAAFGGDRAPELWRTTLTGRAVLLLGAATAETRCWAAALAGFPGMVVGGAHVTLLDESVAQPASMLHAIMKEPDALAEVRLCLERLGKGLAASHAARDSQATAARLEIALAETAVRGDAARAELVTARQEILRLEAKLRAEEAASKRFRNETAATRAQLAVTEAASAAQSSRLADTAAQLASILNSTSWRLTQPLRLALSRTPGLALLLRRSVRLAWRIVRFPVAQHRRVEQPEPAPGPVPSEAISVPALMTPPAPEPNLGTSESLERRVAVLESRLDLERDRIDWALGVGEGVTAMIDAYHSYRQTSEYYTAFDEANPLVSICVATMDRADVLMERCINSIRAQSYRNLQVVVVGDNCTDDTPRRLAALNDARIQFVNLLERGPYPYPGFDRWCVAGSNAMNHALSLCEGRFVTHLDDDDAMVPHRIETLVAAAMEARADFLWHPIWYERENGTWDRHGNGRLELTHVTTGSIFYHIYFARFPWDVYSYRLREPGDWNRLRKIKLLRPRLYHVDEPLLYHYREQSQRRFVARSGERFLE